MEQGRSGFVEHFGAEQTRGGSIDIRGLVMPTLECPTCRAKVTYQMATEVPFRPFCSRRCQLIDLGKWLNEEYRVSEELPPELEDPGPAKRLPPESGD